MADYSSIINSNIARKMRRKLYNIICEHVKHCDDENALEHIEMFMEGLSWGTGLRYGVRGGGVVYVYLRGVDWVETHLIDVYLEIKTLRKSINRHYAKQGGLFYGRD